jgi:hypothetical protein
MMPADASSLERVARSLIDAGDVLTHLGTGGFASTFKVERADGTVVALKVVDPETSDSDRVQRELAALQRVAHENVVPYRDWGETEFEGLTYRWIEMAYVEGRTLRSLLDTGVQHSPAEAARLLRSVVAGAAAIWAQDTAHRDLTPNNILVTAEGKPVIVDLGMARHLHDETITILPTPGTPGWMSPEQVGATPSHGDWRSDQFVLGLVGYRLLTGTAPYVAQNLHEAWFAPAVQTPRPVRAVAPSVPAVIADVVEKMLSIQPHRRYLRAEALVSDLDRAVAALAQNVEVASAAPGFYLEIGQVKTYAVEGGFLEALAPKGVIVDGRAQARMSELCLAAAEAKAEAVIEPSMIFARSPLEARPAQYRDLPHGTEPRLTGFADDETRRAWLQPVYDLHAHESPDVLIAPYFYAGEGELNWVHESLAMATAAKALTPKGTQGAPRIWTGLSLAASWMTSQADRDRMLAAVTAQPHDALYVLVNTAQPSFAPIGDVEVLRGLRDLIEVMAEADVPLIAGRRASSGLLLLALGAAGWGTGVSANQKNGSPHPEEEQTGGQGLDRIYVPQLLNHINLTSYLQILGEPAGTDLLPTTDYGRALLAANPSLDNLTTQQRILLNRHNIAAMKAQVDAMGATAEHARLTNMRTSVIEARNRYRQLPRQRAGEDGGFLDAWLQVL